MSAVQDLLVTPLWMALVWIVHALCVMLEWCFTLDLLDSPTSGRARHVACARCRRAHRAVAPAGARRSPACSSLYDGLVRRRVAETLGQALMMAAMMIGAACG